VQSAFFFKYLLLSIFDEDVAWIYFYVNYPENFSQAYVILELTSFLGFFRLKTPTFPVIFREPFRTRKNFSGSAKLECETER
jgi:hypothetical protein